MRISLRTSILGRFFGQKRPIDARPRRSLGPRIPLGAQQLESRNLLAMVGVDVIDFAFAPNTVTIHQGDMVHWVWDMNDLSTTSAAGLAESWNSGVQNAGYMFDHTFTHVGTFTYYSSVGGSDAGNGAVKGMSGTVVVLPPAPLVSIMVMPAKFSIAAGATQDYMAMGVFADNVMTDVSSEVMWASTNGLAATVSVASESDGMMTGVVTGVAPGSASISATLGAITGSAPVTITEPPQPALVTLRGGQVLLNKNHEVTEIKLSFDGAVNATEAGNVATYRLTLAGLRGSFTADNAKTLDLRSASYNAATNTVVLIPRRPFTLAKPARLVVDGVLPSGLQDRFGRLIDGNRDGQPGGNAVALIRRTGVTIA
jgi:plastocyanin